MNDFKWIKTNGLGFLISDTARLMRKRFDQRARELGLTRAQWQVLAYLAMNEGINQAGLADLLDIEPITLSRQLDKMEEAGWVVRRPDANDRRVRILLLTEQASAVLMKVRALGRSVIEDMIAGLTSEEVEAMRRGLQHVRNSLSDRGGDAPSIEREQVYERRNVQ